MGMNVDDAKSFEEMANEMDTQKNIDETTVNEEVVEVPVSDTVQFFKDEPDVVEEPVEKKLIKKNPSNYGL